MSKKFAAVEDIKKLGAMFAGLMDFAKELESLGSLEQAAKESEARLAMYKSEEAMAKANADIAHQHNADLIAIGERKEKEAEARAQAFMKKASEEANAMLSDASAAVADMQAKCAAKKAASELEVQNLKAQKAALEAEVAEMKQKAEQVKAELNAMKAKFI